MVNYSNGKIYKIVCNIINECYIGATCEPILARRLAQHVSSYMRYLNGKSNYVTSFKIIERDDYDIILIESFPCDTKDQLHARERHYTQTITCVNRVKNQGEKIA
jgi:Mor family transcriptional regulator